MICVNNKKQFVKSCPKGLSKDDLIEFICLDEEINKVIGNLNMDNVYYVPDRMINIITKNKVKKKTNN